MIAVEGHCCLRADEDCGSSTMDWTMVKEMLTEKKKLILFSLICHCCVTFVCLHEITISHVINREELVIISCTK